jgi:hypothetical protein
MYSIVCKILTSCRPTVSWPNPHGGLNLSRTLCHRPYAPNYSLFAPMLKQMRNRCVCFQFETRKNQTFHIHPKRDDSKWNSSPTPLKPVNLKIVKYRYSNNWKLKDSWFCWSQEVCPAHVNALWVYIENIFGPHDKHVFIISRTGGIDVANKPGQ